MTAHLLTGPSAAQRRVYEAEVMNEVIRNFPKPGLIGTSKNAVFRISNKLTKTKGDTYIFQMKKARKGTRRIGNVPRAGHEDDVDYHTDQVTLNTMASGIASQGRLEELKYLFDLREEGKESLGQDFALWWWEDIFDHAQGNTAMSPVFSQTPLAASTNRRYLVGGQTVSGTTGIPGTDNLTATDLPTSQTLKLMKYRAWMADQLYTDYTKIPKVIVDGKPTYVVFMEPAAYWHLKEDDVIQSVLKDASWRGSKNPLFSGASFYWDGLIVHEEENLLREDNGATPAVTCSRNLLCGTSAVLIAKHDNAVRWWEGLVDRGRQWACWGEMICAFKKAQFNSIDWAVQVFDCASPDPVETS